MAEIKLAFDKGSARTYDADGRLHVALTNISKANVCPYYGSEIPDSDKLGLDPKKLYYLLRDPEELEKAVPTCNNIQLLIKHIPVSTEDPQKDSVVGSTGTDGQFKKPFLQNSLVVWDAVAIAGIESEEQKELSCGYRYRADMTPGTYEGVPYDGVMRDIVFNHVALVEQGRAGSDVVVGDEKPSNLETSMSQKKFTLSRKAAMVKGALAVFLKPKLANDAKIDLNPILADVTNANWAQSKTKIVQAIKVASKGKMAKDSDVDGVNQVLDSMDEDMPDGEDGAVDQKNPDSNMEGATDPKGTNSGAEDNDPMEQIKAFLQGKISDEDLAQVEQMFSAPAAADPVAAPAATDPPADGKDDGKAELIARLKAILADLEGGQAPAADEPPSFPGKPAAPAPNKEKPMGLPDKAAMDAAIKTAVKNGEQRVLDIADAKEIVKPLIGEIKIAADSAEQIYRLALDEAGVDVSDVHPSAFKAMVKMLATRKAEKQTQPVKLAHDAAVASKVASRFPEAKMPTQLG